MLCVLLVLGAAPQVSVSSTEVRLDGKVVLSPIADDAYLNVPELDVALRELPAQVQPELHFAPEVPFRVGKRILFTFASALRPASAFFVGQLGPLNIAPPQPMGVSSWPVIQVTPTTDAAAAVRTSHLHKSAAKGVTLSVADAVTMQQLAQVMRALEKAGVSRQIVAPEFLDSPRSTLKGK